MKNSIFPTEAAKPVHLVHHAVHLFPALQRGKVLGGSADGLVLVVRAEGNLHPQPPVLVLSRLTLLEHSTQTVINFWFVQVFAERGRDSSLL